MRTQLQQKLKHRVLCAELRTQLCLVLPRCVHINGPEAHYACLNTMHPPPFLLILFSFSLQLSQLSFSSSPNPSSHFILAFICIAIFIHHHQHQLAMPFGLVDSLGISIGFIRLLDHQERKRCYKAPSSRTRGTSSHQQTSQEAERYETPSHAERGRSLSERNVIHIRTIKFLESTQDTFKEHIFMRGWKFMYEPAIPINMSLVRKFYVNNDKKDQREVYIRGRKISCYYKDIERVLHIPRLEWQNDYREMGEAYVRNEQDMNEVVRVIGKEGVTWPSVPGRLNKEILDKEAWMWMKLIVCNIVPTRHETTFSIDHILMIYALMKGMSVSLPRIMFSNMNTNPTKSKKHMLPFPMFITKWAEEANVPTYPGDEIRKIPKGQQFFP
ncbi:hypothetical protein PIB30_081255 [Stylosanthes scabra]|uniref:Putative plant transposon protein domain-containing protein n=1 Tax=Stylosanthes scabra TaxID=79078 RepID=A0ABU6SRW1_9FABA|nr:hypothetical protein [Stylosanthes scabra]